MNDIDLETWYQQAAKQNAARTTSPDTRSANANFAVQLKSAVTLTNAKLRERAAAAGTAASGTNVISAAVRLRGQTTAQQKSTGGTTTAPNAATVVGATGSAASTSTTDAALASTGDSSATALLQATQRMQELNQSFNLQYLQLQENEQAENRQFTALSNVMKLKNDTAKNSLSNLK